MYNNSFITKAYILNILSQEDIFSLYWGVSSATIYECTHYNTLINSLIRSEQDPSMGFTYRNSKLICRDFAGYFWGDCFDAVGYTLNLDPNINSSFMLILKDIAKRFGLNSPASVPVKIDTQKHVINKVQTVIQVNSRDWNNNDADYWFTRYTLTRKDLNDAYIYAAQSIFINNVCKYIYNPKDPCYAYYLGEQNGLHIWKLYYPYRTTYRFMSNLAAMQGMLNIKDADEGIIIKSYKEVVVGRKLANLLNVSIDFVATSTEVLAPSKAVVTYLRTRWKRIWSFFDFDRTGIRLARQLRRLYGIEPIFLTNGRFGSIDYKAKDLSDYLEYNGLDKTLTLSKQFIDVTNNIISSYQD